MPDLFDSIEADVAEATAREMRAIADDIKERVSIPVGYRIGPRGGTYKIRSKPGEPPRKDTGNLQASITPDTIVVGDQVAGSIQAKAPYSDPLENQMDRLIMTDLLDEFSERFADAVARAAGNR